MRFISRAARRNSSSPLDAPTTKALHRVHRFNEEIYSLVLVASMA